ncbi:MAG: transporter substrate-binding domain-containing protein [Rhodoferax sp.]|nr:transporter substrate-binding domain-containing protein [Rhodoferax sp.]
MLLSGAPTWALDKVRIGAEDDWRPYSYVSGGEPVGFAVDIVKAAWAAAGVTLELVPLPYARCMRLVDNGELDGCFDTLRDPRTEANYRWHRQPLFKARIAIYGRTAQSGASTVGLKNLRGRRIGVTNGYDYGEAFDNDSRMVRDVGVSDLASLRKLVAGRVDYALVFDRVAGHIADLHPELAPHFVQRGVLVEPLLFVSFKREGEALTPLIARFDRGLNSIRKSGEYARIEARWK